MVDPVVAGYAQVPAIPARREHFEESYALFQTNNCLEDAVSDIAKPERKKTQEERIVVLEIKVELLERQVEELRLAMTELDGRC